MAGFILLLKKCVSVITFRVKAHKKRIRTYNGIKYNIISIITTTIIIMVIIITVGVITIIIIIIM